MGSGCQVFKNRQYRGNGQRDDKLENPGGSGRRNTAGFSDTLNEWAHFVALPRSLNEFND
jgi:hypothetical protein